MITYLLREYINYYPDNIIMRKEIEKNKTITSSDKWYQDFTVIETPEMVQWKQKKRKRNKDNYTKKIQKN